MLKGKRFPTGFALLAAAAGLLLTTGDLAAQQMLGRAVRQTDGSPILEALIVLLDQGGHEVARTVTSPTGVFQLRAPEAGKYHIRVQRIGQRGWESPAFEVTAKETARPTLRVPDMPFPLEELSASARRPNCSVTLGDASIGGRLLEAAQTALGLAEAEMAGGRRNYITETYQRTVPLVGPPKDSVIVPGRLYGWPIQSADPDSLRVTGFVRGDWPAPSPLNERPESGPTYFGPDARVLFTDWFLGSHCISVESQSARSGDSPLVIARFKPAKGTPSAAALQGSLEFDPASLALKALKFEFAARPRWAPPESSGGEIDFARLPDGAWIPVKWTMRAPVPRVTGDGQRYELFAIMESGGRVSGVRGPNGRPDRRTEAALGLDR